MIPVSFVNLLISSTKFVGDKLATVTLIAFASRFLPIKSKAITPLGILDSSTLFVATAPIPSASNSFDNCSAICPAIMLFGIVTVALRPLCV